MTTLNHLLINKMCCDKIAIHPDKRQDLINHALKNAREHRRHARACIAFGSTSQAAQFYRLAHNAVRAARWIRNHK